ncbi:MAG: DNA-processing protein DprA [Chloroflexi bacterium]|nr:DNA-processing protein DprA [Chloroflexota bacterium]
MTTTQSAASGVEPTFNNLAVHGHGSRLREPGIALCGSRAAGVDGIAFANAVGMFAAQADLSLVSGYAKGVDMAGHVACVEAGGHTIAVLAEGLGRFRLRRELRAVIEPRDELEQHLTAVSQFESNAGWTVWRAMQRNDLICALGVVLVAIDPGDSGGTHDAVKKAIKREMPVVIGWSDSDRDRAHVDLWLSKPRVWIASSEEELIAAIDEALTREAPTPEVSQPTLL